jgi:hypothetical protein
MGMKMSVHSILNYLGDNVKHIADGAAALAAFGALAQVLPPLASLLTIIWMSLRIYDWFEARFIGGRLPKD